jgi:hypothetical protein
MNELVNTLVELTERYRHLMVIVAFNELLALEVEEDACCISCQRKADWLHGEISQLLAGYEREFPALPAVAQINHRGVGRVQ